MSLRLVQMHKKQADDYLDEDILLMYIARGEGR